MSKLGHINSVLTFTDVHRTAETNNETELKKIS